MQGRLAAVTVNEQAIASNYSDKNSIITRTVKYFSADLFRLCTEV